MAPPTEDVVAYLDQIQLDSLDKSPVARGEILAAAERLVARMRTPIEQMVNVSFAPPVAIGALQIFRDLGIWEAWCEAGGGEKTLVDLIGMANAEVDANLLRRICRVLTGLHLIDESGEERYSATGLVYHLGNKDASNWQELSAFSDHWLYGGPCLPRYLKRIGYQEPRDLQDTAYKLGNPEQLQFWTRCQENAAYRASFSGSMEAWTRSKVPWPKFYDTDLLLEAADLSAPLVVDVGGNIGNDLLRFLDKHPNVPSGSLVLQDRPDALKSAVVNDKIKVMPHDFFTPQPVIGSRAYFLHAVLHDWPDKEAADILQHLAKAMKKGYSKLLICDIALPATNASGIQAVMDVGMMSLFSAGERTLQNWTDLLTQSGFRITQLKDDPSRFETLIEAELN